MIAKKIRKKSCSFIDIIKYRLQQILFYLGFIIPFPFILIYGLLIDMDYNNPYDPRYEYEFIPELGEVVDEFGNDYYYK